jgi:hypothetical protein
MDQFIPPSFLFEYSLSIPRRDALPGSSRKLPTLLAADTLFVPARLNATPAPRIRMAWNTAGVAVEVRVQGRSMPIAGRWSDPVSSDLLRLFFNTRHRSDVQRATSFCSTLVILPVDEESEGAPRVEFRNMLQTAGGESGKGGTVFRTRVDLTDDGYEVGVWIPGSMLAGYSEIEESGVLGFSVLIEDSELGRIPIDVGGDFPTQWNPSLWIPLQLAAESSE